MQGYPTDEELNSFIEEIEREEMYVPKHLKEEILLKAQKQTAMEKSEHNRAQSSSFLLYTLKMAAGMAAAVLLVFMIPAGDGSNISLAKVPKLEWDASEEERLQKDRDKVSLGDRISRYMNEKREENDKEENKISDKLDELFHKNDLGGDDNES